MTTDANRLTSDATPMPAGPVPMILGSCVKQLLDALERLGHDGAALLATARLSRSQLTDPDALVPCTSFAELIEGAQRARPRKNLALALAAVTPIGAYPLIDYLVLSSQTVGEGMRRLSRYYRLVGSPTPLELREDEDPIRVIVDCPIPFTLEYAVALPVLHLRREGGAQARWVSFGHRPDDPSEFADVLGCEVRADQPWGGFALSREAWQLPMPRRDPVLLGLLERQADAAVSSLPSSDTLAVQVRRAQAAGLADGDASIDAIGRALAIAPRTLQRRLADDGTSFQRLLDEVRRETAERHLKGSVFSIAEISFVLGYSEPAAFHRAFRRWNDTTPQSYRAARRERAS